MSNSDTVKLLSGVSAVVAIVTGMVLYVLLMPMSAQAHIHVLGLVWVLFGVCAFYSIYVFEHQSQRKGAIMLIYFGVVGLAFGVGFFVSALLMVVSGSLALKGSGRKIGVKISS